MKKEILMPWSVKVVWWWYLTLAVRRGRRGWATVHLTEIAEFCYNVNHKMKK